MFRAAKQRVVTNLLERQLIKRGLNLHQCLLLLWRYFPFGQECVESSGQWTFPRILAALQYIQPDTLLPIAEILVQLGNFCFCCRDSLLFRKPRAFLGRRSYLHRHGGLPWLWGVFCLGTHLESLFSQGLPT